MNAFAGIRPNFPRGVKTRSLAFFPGVCSGGYLFSSGVQPSQPPRQFLPCPNTNPNPTLTLTLTQNNSLTVARLKFNDDDEINDESKH